jgi:hypothetical protein
MEQLLVSVMDNGTISVQNINATVPSGLQVAITDMRTDLLYVPIKIELEPMYSGKGSEGVLASIETARKAIQFKLENGSPRSSPWAWRRGIKEEV